MEPNLIYRPQTEPLVQNNNNRKKILIAVGAVVLIGIIIFAIYKSGKLPFNLTHKEEMQIIPLVIGQKKTVKVVSIKVNDKNKLYRVVEIDMPVGKAQEMDLFIPKDVTPSFVGTTKVQEGSILEILKYQVVSGGLIVHALKIEPPLDLKKKAAEKQEEGMAEGVVTKINVDTKDFVMASYSAKSKKYTYYEVIVPPGTQFMRIKDGKILSLDENGFTLASLYESQNVVRVYYVKLDGSSNEVMAKKVEVFNL